MNTNLIIIHYGELALKKRNRAHFEDRLVSMLRAKLKDTGLGAIQKLPGRILVEFDDVVCWDSVSDRLRKVFGFSVASPAHRTAPDMADLESKMVGEALKLEFNSFAVRAKRADKKFPLTSPEICSRVGAAIKEKTGARVDLERPEKLFNIEVMDGEIFFSTERMKGPGGLPSGISGHVAALISGGIDSPVASWMMMKRGLKNSFIHFHSMPFTDMASIEKVEDMVGRLSEWQMGGKLALVPFGDVQKKIVTAAPAKYRVILYRRFMMLIASKLGAEIGAEAIVTGEAMGQVASQTLANLRSVEDAAELPVLRPLIGMDKQEIVDKAIEIGTYDLSIVPHQDCCSFLQPPNPATRTSPEEMCKVEKSLDVSRMVGNAIEGVSWREF